MLSWSVLIFQKFLLTFKKKFFYCIFLIILIAGLHNWSAAVYYQIYYEQRCLGLLFSHTLLRRSKAVLNRPDLSSSLEETNSTITHGFALQWLSPDDCQICRVKASNFQQCPLPVTFTIQLTADLVQRLKTENELFDYPHQWLICSGLCRTSQTFWSISAVWCKICYKPTTIRQKIWGGGVWGWSQSYPFLRKYANHG